MWQEKKKKVRLGCLSRALNLETSWGEKNVSYIHRGPRLVGYKAGGYENGYENSDGDRISRRSGRGSEQSQL